MFCRSEGRIEEQVLRYVLEGWWQSQCVVAHILPLLCGLHCAMLSNLVPASPMSHDLFGSPSGRL